MKKYIILLTAIATLSVPAIAQETMDHKMMNHNGHNMQAMEHNGHNESASLMLVKKVKSSKVCMVNDTVFEKDQIAINVDGKTYYGCCSMCEERLKADAKVREAIDSLTGETVDKATAIIGSDESGKAYYFEDEDNFKAYQAKYNADKSMEK